MSGALARLEAAWGLGLWLGASGAAAATPGQAIVFDGSAAASDTFVVAFESTGFRVDLGTGTFTCPGVAHVSPGGVVTPGPEESGVFASYSGLQPELTSFLFSQPPLAPAAVEAFYDDCDVRDGFDVAQGHLAQSLATAQTRVADVAVCVTQVESAYCDLVSAIEAATIVPDIPSGARTIAGPGLGAMAPPNQLSCTRLRQQLAVEIPYRLEAIALELATCQSQRAALIQMLANLGPVLGETLRDVLLDAADLALEQARLARGRAQDVLAAIAAIGADLSLAEAQANCAQCPPLAPPYLLPSGIVSTGSATAVLDQLAQAFENAAAVSGDPDEAARLSAVAARMRSIPGDRVLQLTHPAASAVGTHSVALHPAGGAAGGSFPLAVVLSAEAAAGEANLIDHHIAVDAWRTLARTLDPAFEPPDDDDDDDDGLRDAYETDAGTFVSRLATGSDPWIADSDADRYQDGTEVATGSDPNDPGSVPSAPGMPIPALSRWGAALLLVTLGAGARFALRRRRGE